MPDTPVSNALTDADAAFINDTLLKYGHEESMLDMSEVDGYLTAMVSSPALRERDDWLPDVWGGLDFSVDWESDTERLKFEQLLQQHFADLAHTLNAAPEQYSAYFGLRESDSGDVYVVEEWCFGYMRALTEGDAFDGGLPKEAADYLGLIAYLVSDEAVDELDAITAADSEELAADLQYAAVELYNYWHSTDQAPKGPARNEQTVGRNDPCPCGSGKQFKQCCLN